MVSSKHYQVGGVVFSHNGTCRVLEPEVYVIYKPILFGKVAVKDFLYTVSIVSMWKVSCVPNLQPFLTPHSGRYPSLGEYERREASFPFDGDKRALEVKSGGVVVVMEESVNI